MMDLNCLLNFPNLLTLLISIVAIIILQKYFSNTRKVLPGPLGLPIPFKLRKFDMVSLAKLAATYGKISSVKIGCRRLVFINDYQVEKEVVRRSTDFSQRSIELMNATGGENTVLAMPHHEVTLFRRVFINGINKNMKFNIDDEIKYLLQEMDGLSDNEFNPQFLYRKFSSNIISRSMVGQRDEYSNASFDAKVRSGMFIEEQIVWNSIFYYFPWLRPLSLFLFRIWNSENLKLKESARQIAIRNLQTVKEGFVDGSSEHVSDAFLTERCEQIRKTGTESLLTEDRLLANILFSNISGGSALTSSLLWITFCVGTHLNVHNKLRKEIQDVIGANRTPLISDQPEMPYAQAIVYESQRYSSTTVLLNGSSNPETTELSGFIIPKKSIILFNQWALNNSSKLWKNPEIFQPERFIDSDGKLLKKEFLLPFSLGRRRCVGELLSQSLLFQYITTLCHRYNIEVKMVEKSCNKARLSFVNLPPPFKIRLNRNTYVV